MLGRNGNIAYVRYDHQGRIVAGGPIISAKPPKNGNWQAVSNVLGTNTTNNALRAFIRVDYFNRVVPSSLVLLTKEPGDNNSQTTWIEVNAQYRGNGITTTTTTTLPPISTTTTSTTSEPIVILDCNIHWNSNNLCENGSGIVNIDFVANPGATSLCNATYLYTNLMPDAYIDGRLIYIREVGSSLIRLGQVTDDQTRVVFGNNVCIECSTTTTTSTTAVPTTTTTTTVTIDCEFIGGADATFEGYYPTTSTTTTPRTVTFTYYGRHNCGPNAEVRLYYGFNGVLNQSALVPEQGGFIFSISGVVGVTPILSIAIRNVTDNFALLPYSSGQVCYVPFNLPFMQNCQGAITFQGNDDTFYLTVNNDPC